MPYIPRIQSIINKADACSAGSKKAGLVYGSDFTRVPYNILKSRTPTNILFSATTGNCCSGNSSEYNKGNDNKRGNINANDGSTIYSPSFTQDYSTGCSSGAPIINENTITFRPGRVRSVESYKNISKITATVDLNGMTNINWINASFYIIQNNKVAKVSIVGAGMVSTPGITYKMFRGLADSKINILAISTSEIKISVIIEEEFTLKAVKKLHSIFNLD